MEPHSMANKGPSQGQQPPRDPRRPTSSSSSRRPASAASAASAAPPASAARPAPRAPPAPSAYVEPGPPRARVAAPPTEARAAAPAHAPPAARAPRALAAERAAGAAAATHHHRSAAPARAEPAVRAPRAPTAAAGAAYSREHSVTEHQQLRSMPSLEALDELQLQPYKKISPRVQLALASKIHQNLEAMGMTPRDLDELVQQDELYGPPLTEYEVAQLALVEASLPRAPRPRRPRTSESDSDSEYKRQRVGFATSVNSLSSHSLAMDEDQDTLTYSGQASGQASPAPTYADLTRATFSPPPPTAPPSDPAQPAQTPSAPRPRYPPLIVESLPNWAHHFKVMKSHLGRAPNARPFGKGVKFTPKEDQEYRYVQRYLSTLEKTEKVSWFSYSLPAERNIKVAIRGIPADTDPDAIKEDLRDLGFDPEFVRPIRARKGRPGCIFLAILRRTPKTIPEIYQVKEILCMPGIKIEAWRGKRGPAQCHKCQKFRHSSHNCHRQQACVRCGEEHSAHACQRPLTEPATCANCGGAHPANHVQCPVFRKEARNKRAGTVAATATSAKPADKKRDKPQPHTAAPQQQGANIRTPANEPRARGTETHAANGKRRPRGRRGGRKVQPRPQPHTSDASPAPRETNRDDTVIATIEILNEVLQAVRDGQDPTPIILRGLASIISSSAR